MPKSNDPLNHLRVAAPCEVAWESMTGDERVRHCSLCSLNVYNFADMTREEIGALLLKTEGRICGRLYRRADGTLLTSDCPTELRALRRRMSRFAAAIGAALFSVSAFASGEAPRMRMHGSNVTLEIEQATAAQHAVFTGVVRSEEGAPLPGVTIKVRDEAAVQRECTAITDVNGAFRLSGLSHGLYSVRVTLAGLEPAAIEHLALKENEVTHATIVMRFEAEMGIIMVDPARMVIDGTSTTFSQELINKLPV